MQAEFKITGSYWPYANVLEESRRRQKINKVKKSFKSQLRTFKKEAETNSSQAAALLHRIEQCKLNQHKLNALISDYNANNPKKKSIKPIPSIDYTTWRSGAQALFFQDIAYRIISLVPFEDFNSFSRVCKPIRSFIVNDPVLRFNLKISDLHICMINHLKEVHLLDNLKKRLKKYKYNSLNTLIEELKSIHKKYPSNLDEVMQLRSNLLETAKLSQESWVYIFVRLRLKGLLDAGRQETELRDILQLAKQKEIVLEEEEINKLLSEDAKQVLEVSECIDKRLFYRFVGIGLDDSGF